MQDALLGLAMLAVGWLVIWFCTDRSKLINTWWPFDFKTSDPIERLGDEPAPSAGWRRNRWHPRRQWKRSGS
jgi:hypothetical protein